MDALLLARMQFGANITFHILFPTISIALGWMLLFFRLRWLKTKAPVWLNAYRFYTKVFALTFALGIVTGVTMSFQFGTNWPGYMERVGDVAGPLLAYEVLTAFFLEAGFLGIMLFGHGKVSERVHLLATFFVAFGTTLSAFWILALNSWMQTPAGHEIVDGAVIVRSWAEVIFNPSFPYRLAHKLLASALTVAFLVAGIAAWQLLRGGRQASAPLMLRVGLTLAALLIPLQIVVGDFHGLNTLKHQPAKIAAMEGVWETGTSVPLLLFGWPNELAKRNDWALEVPGLASFVLTHDFKGEVRGLNEFTDAHPPVAPVFFAFRIMVGMGVLMLLVSWLAWWKYRRAGWQAERLPRWLLRGLAAMTFSGWIATVAGWYVTEIGRQPFLVYGILRTADAASDVAAPMILATLVMYVLLYVALLVAYISVMIYMASKPEEVLEDEARDRAASPVGAITAPVLGGSGRRQ